MRLLNTLYTTFATLCLLAAAPVLGQEEFLPPEQAFQLDASADAQGIHLRWRVAPGYYLYRDKFRVEAGDPHTALGDMVIAPGKFKDDPLFGRVEVHRDSARIDVPVRAAGAMPVVISATSQGCADLGLCYPPYTRQVTLLLQAADTATALPPAADTSVVVTPAGDGAPVAATDAKATRLAALAEALGVGRASATAPSPVGADARPAALLDDARRSATLSAAVGASDPAPILAAAGTSAPADAERLSALAQALGVTGTGSTSAAQDPLPSTASPVTPAADDDALSALSALGKGLSRSLGLGDEEAFLDPEVAFVLETALVDGNTLRARWRIADDYYLYRDKFSFRVTGGDGVALQAASMPAGKLKRDANFGDVAVFYHEAVATLPLVRTAGTGRNLSLQISYQGCADAGLCYPPIDKQVSLVLPASFVPAAGAPGLGVVGASTVGVASAPVATAEPVSEQDQLTAVLLAGDLWVIVGVFFLGGLLLSLTPCVFPMIPILSSIIVGQGEDCSRARAFTLSFIYVQGMAITYTVAGVAAGLTGANLPAMFQEPAVLVTFAAVFVLLAMSMFGFYDLQIPAALQARLTHFSNRQRSGSYTGAGVMGVLSALIVGPCVAPPLVGALGYIGNTGDPVLGGVALYALSLGMGMPLLAVGLSAGQLLPRAGAWMQTVKAVFGVLLLGVAVFFLDRVLPGWVTMLLWAALLICSAIYMGALDHLERSVNGWRRLWKGTGLVLMVYGVLLMVGATGGNTDPLQPLKGLALAAGDGTHADELRFQQVKGVTGLREALRQASAAGRPVMLDYYADWCISCKEMEKFTFSDPGVQAALAQAVLLQTDVTANDAEDKALLERFGLLGPPTIQFFMPDGNERKGFRVVGYMDAERFREHVLRAFSI